MAIATIVWTGGVLGAVVVAVRVGRSPLERPAPTAVAVGAGSALLGSLLGLGPVWQATMFVATAAGLGLLLWRWRVLLAEDNLDRGVGGNRLVGMTGVVVAPVGPEDHSGTVRLASETWHATTPADAHLAPGQAVSVVAVEGIHLIVQPVHAGHHERLTESDSGGPA